MKYSRCPVMLLVYVCTQAMSRIVSAASAQVCASVSPLSPIVLESGTGKARMISGIVYYVPANGSMDAHSAVMWKKDGDPPLNTSVNIAVRIVNPSNALIYKNDEGELVEQIEIETSAKKILSYPSEVILRNLSNAGTNDSTVDESVSEQAIRLEECFRLWYKNQKRPSAVYEIPVQFFLKGQLLGKTGVQLGVRERASEEWSWLLVTLLVLRDRHKVVLNHIFIGVLSILIIIANVLMGCKLQLHVIRSVIRKPLAPVVGMLSQFLFMPLVSFVLAILIFDSPNLRSLGLGLFTTGCSPGGGASNFYTVLLDGNVDLSITMTFISTVAAAGLMPAWLFTLGNRFLTVSGTEEIKIPYKNIGISLGVLVLPLLLGILLRRFLPKIADGLLKGLRPFLLLIILFICTFGIYANLYMFKLMTWRVLLCGLLLPLVGFIFGAGLAVICGQPRDNVVAIAIETGIQNSGIAIMLLKLSFPQPDGDLSSVIPVVVSMFTPGPLLLAYVVHSIRKCRQRADLEYDLEEDMPKPESKVDKKAPWFRFFSNGTTGSKLTGLVGQTENGQPIEMDAENYRSIPTHNGYLLCQGAVNEGALSVVKGAESAGTVFVANGSSSSACPLVPGVSYNM